jgi:hypothetical protein
MISLAILSFLAGAALGLWFRVPVLALAIVLALIAVFAAGAATEVNPWWIALEALEVTVCLQLGYIAGNHQRHLRSHLGIPNPATGSS